MAQWQEVQSLANTYLEQVHQLYAGSALPMAVRQSLAAWIETQNWRQAAEPLCSQARMLFHSLLVVLGERLGSLGSDREDFMLKHNLRKAHRDLQAEFEEEPERFANLVANLLQEERRILRLGQAGGQGRSAPAPSPAPESGREQQIQRRLAEFHTALQEAERAFRHLEDLQDAFDFCYKVHYQPGGERNEDPEYIQELQSLQAKLQNLDRQRREVLAQMQQLLGRSETLQELLQQELGGWRTRQQRLCLGGPGDTNLRPLETWFTELGQGLFQLRQLLRALGDLRQKVTYARDPLVAETPLLEQRLQEQLTHLLKSAFVVEQQPSTPNAGKRPLVLRTAGKFSTRARLLVRLHDRNHGMEARIHMDRDPPNIKGAGPHPRLTLPSPQTLKEQKDSRAGKGKGASGEGPLVVTEELHLITFTLAYAYCGLELELEATTLPFVIISNNNQFSSAWASILWFNMLSSDPKASGTPALCHPCLVSPALLPVPSLALPLAQSVSWLSPVPCPQVYGLPCLLLILGFVSHKQAEKLLKSRRTGTFLLRFSESVLGGVTFTWVEHHETGFVLKKFGETLEVKNASRPPSKQQTEEELAVATENLETLQLQPRGQGTPGTLGTLQRVATSPGTLQVVAMSPGTLQVTPGSLGTPQRVAMSPGTLQVVAMSPGTLQVTSGSLGTPQVVATSPGIPQVTPGNLGTPQGVASRLGTPQVVATSPGTLQPMGLGTLQPQPQSLEPPQVTSAVPNMQGTLKVTPGAVGTVQVLPGGLQMLQVCSEDLGTLQGTMGTLQLGAVEPPRVPEEQGTLPAELRDLELLPGGQDMQELLQGSRDVQELLLQSLEGLEAAPGTLGTLGTLGVTELMPDVVATLEESFQLSPGSAALLDQRDPFLPQPEDSAVPSVPSLFTDFPPLHIDASDFQ
ncbi:signal transducer and activator of transcription 2 [Pyrgilauda ruficollis]|uniref:signal transducer and activator of transcription 2 n=1 Tax=Pyrgilauda ruficollis TaxID=221976 RepID=UPI001B86B06C|nr:signal transducer and activator of transcription 2 [Pyrgilauda ruficollis]